MTDTTTFLDAQASTGPVYRKAELTGDEMFDALTGFEEIAIAKCFGRSVESMFNADRLQLSRALVFAHLRRDGHKDAEAYRQAQEMGTRRVRDYFLPNEPEPMPHEPVTESGKDD